MSGNLSYLDSRKYGYVIEERVVEFQILCTVWTTCHYLIPESRIMAE